MISYLIKIFIKFSIVAVLLIFSMTTQAFAAPTSIAQMSASDFFKSGVEKIQSGDLEQALVEFTQAIRLNSQLAGAYSNRCLIYIQLADYPKAAEDCTKALQLNPDSKVIAAERREHWRASAYLNRGLAYYRQARYLEAIADYNQMIQLKPFDYRAYYNRGLALAQQQDYQKAIADYNQALRQIQAPYSQEMATIYNDRGLAHFQLGNISRAMQDFSQAIRLNANDARAYYNRGCVCHRQSDYAGSIRDFTLSLQRNPNQAEAYVHRGIARYQLRYQQAALEDLQKAAAYFSNQGQMVAYQQTLNLIEKIQQQSQSNVESEIA
jgi:tetratricopeptide (TPR) repeat protein